MVSRGDNSDTPLARRGERTQLGVSSNFSFASMASDDDDEMAQLRAQRRAALGTAGLTVVRTSTVIQSAEPAIGVAIGYRFSPFIVPADRSPGTPAATTANTVG